MDGEGISREGRAAECFEHLDSVKRRVREEEGRGGGRAKGKRGEERKGKRRGEGEGNERKGKGRREN